MQVTGNFEFRSVGQGLFYSGILNKGCDIFSFVYDCGSDTKGDFLKNEIVELENIVHRMGQVGKAKIDLLVISHFHDDHINGLECLFDKFNVDTVIMPYTTLASRLLALMESEYENINIDVNFYIKPDIWLKEKGVQNVIFIVAEGDEYINDEDIINNEGYGERGSYEIGRLNVTDRSKVLGYKDDNSRRIATYLKTNVEIELNNFAWVFKFENLCFNKKKIEAFIQAVNDVTGNIIDIFNNKNLIKELKKISEQKFVDQINRTSLAMLHKPIVRMNSIKINGKKREYPCMYSKDCKYNSVCNPKIWYKIDKCEWCYGYTGIFHASIARLVLPFQNMTVLTGDLTLNKTEKLKILENINDKIVVLQYPHHGSRNNNIEYFLNLNPYLNVISYGVGNKHKHPHNEVTTFLNIVCHANQCKEFAYEIIL